MGSEWSWRQAGGTWEPGLGPSDMPNPNQVPVQHEAVSGSTGLFGSAPHPDTS